METPQTTPAVYFQSLTIENVRCFKGEHTIDLSDGNGKPAMWTVILGNNNTGKTTLLRCLADLEPTKMSEKKILDSNNQSDGESERFLTSKIYKATNEIERKKKYQRKNTSDLPYRVFSGLIIQQGLSYSDLSQLLEKMGYPIQIHPSKFWGFGPGILQGIYAGNKIDKVLLHMLIYPYGATRRAARQDLPSDQRGIVLDPFLDTIEYLNVEDWLLRIHIAKQGGESNAEIAWNLVEKLFQSAMPDVLGMSVETNSHSLESMIVARTNAGTMPLRNLGYGYQSMAVWLADFAQKMLQRYNYAPDSFAQPAIVLIDELDSHLHPEWQRTIISTLKENFPRTQFIVTTHSPLIVQSFEKVNLVVLHKNEEDDSVEIKQYVQQSFQGWTVEEILRDVMRMGDRVYSEKYAEIHAKFDAALDAEDYEEAKRWRDELKRIMHKSNPYIHLLDRQVSSLNGA